MGDSTPMQKVLNNIYSNNNSESMITIIRYYITACFANINNTVVTTDGHRVCFVCLVIM